MNKNEKKVVGVVVVIFILVLVYTIYLESQTQLAPTQLAADLANDELDQPATVNLRGIPKGFEARDLPDEKSRGAEVLKLYCIQCHSLTPPAMHSSEQWLEIVARMEERMKARKGGMFSRVLVPAERDWLLLRDYLQKYGQKALEPESLNDLQTPGGQAFITVCSQCHSAPDPSQHTAKQWHRTVLRMRINMENVGIAPPAAEKMEMIIDYLQKHAQEGV